MDTMKRTRIFGLVFLATFASVTAWSFDRGRRGPGRMEPPAEAVQACAGRNDGDEVTVTLPHGDEISAVCRPIGNRLVAVPKGVGPDAGISRMAEALGLTSEQQAQVRAIEEAHRAKLEPLMEELASLCEKIESAINPDLFDEVTVRSLAVDRAALMVETTVAGAQMRHDIDAVLTADQRALAQEQSPPRALPFDLRPDCGPPPCGP